MGRPVGPPMPQLPSACARAATKRSAMPINWAIVRRHGLMLTTTFHPGSARQRRDYARASVDDTPRLDDCANQKARSRLASLAVAILRSRRMTVKRVELTRHAVSGHSGARTMRRPKATVPAGSLVARLVVALALVASRAGAEDAPKADIVAPVQLDASPVPYPDGGA